MIALVLDTETTGLVYNHTVSLDKQSEITEYYGCLIDLKSGKVKSDYETLVQPKNYPMDAYTIKATKTKITNDMLADAPTFKAVADKIAKQIEKAPVVIAHNASFDKELLDIEFERLGRSIKWPERVICTVEQTNHLRGYRMTLTALHEHLFKKPFADAHRAKPDTQALAKCCVKLFKMGVIA